jgi:hypothetical protein
MQYIRAIRSILVVSNLGCCGVNPALRARHTQAIRAFCGVASKKLVNSGSINAVNIRSTEMMKKFPRDRVITGRSDRAPALFLQRSLYGQQCFLECRQIVFHSVPDDQAVKRKVLPAMAFSIPRILSSMSWMRSREDRGAIKRPA